MSYGYGRQNPFDQRDSPSNGGGYASPPSYNQGSYNQGGRYDDYNQSNVEMAPLARNAGAPGAADPNAILNECQSIDQGIREIEQNLQQIRMLQDRSLNEADGGSATTRQLDAISSETMALYRGLTERVRQVKSKPEGQSPRNAPQVARIDRALKAAIRSFQEVESAHRKKTQNQMARQYRIVKPEASEEEVRAVVEDAGGNQQVFQQAMMQSDRRGQARAVLSAVQDRHNELLKIEKQMVELAQLFQDMDTLVVQQDAQIVQIEEQGEEVVDNLDKGNVEIQHAVVSAKGARRKKWICLGICVAILVVIAIIVVAYIFLRPGGASGNAKRSFEDGIPGIRLGPELTGQLRGALPGGVFGEQTAKRAAEGFTSSEDNSASGLLSLVKRTIRPPPPEYFENHPIGNGLVRRYMPRPTFPIPPVGEN